MKKLLLAGIAVLSVLHASAAAQQGNLPGHAEYIRQIAVADFILEIRDHDLREVGAHDNTCSAPIKRSNTSWKTTRLISRHTDRGARAGRF
jgi:hypothetical protein